MTAQRRRRRCVRAALRWPRCSLLLALAPAAAHAEVIERVAAVVNDEAILLSDLRRRAAPFLEQALVGRDERERARKRA